MISTRRLRRLAVSTAALTMAGRALAHHGFGLFDMNTPKSTRARSRAWSSSIPIRTCTSTSSAPDGKPFAMRCEMRAATLIKRSGWTPDMFVPGTHVVIEGHPHRDDPHSCYLESFTLGGKSDRPQRPVHELRTRRNRRRAPRRCRRASRTSRAIGPSSKAVLTVPPSGGRGDIVPKSVRDAYATGKIKLEQIRARTPPAARP